MLGKQIFIDTNILIYALSDEKLLLDKKRIAVAVLEKSPILSTQIINECSNVLRRKFKWEYHEIEETFDFILKIVTVVDINLSIIRRAWQLGQKYHYSYFDSLVLSSALESKCEILYSEDMQDGQLIENQLKIINPFKISV